jgi:hypothetical protein
MSPEALAPMTSAQPPAAPAAPEPARARKSSEDWAYTINHTIVCFTTDAMQIPLAAGSAMIAGTNTFTRGAKKVLGKAAEWIGCGDVHFNPKEPFWPQYRKELKHWFKGEIIGDLGAVPITVGLQYFAPGLMQGINRTLEPVVGPWFKRGAEKSTKKWAAEHGIAEGSAEYRQHADEIYRHEVDHLAQAVVWTATSVPINYVVQKFDRHEHDHPHPHVHPEKAESFIGRFAFGKVLAAGITLGAVMNLRRNYPETIRAWDGLTEKYLFSPVTTTVNGLFGVKPAPKENAAEAAPSTHISQPQLTQRVSEPAAAPAR